MSAHPIPNPAPRQVPFVLEGFALGCGQGPLHLCKVRDADALAKIWPWMREGLLRIQAKNRPLTHWMPEHVRMELAKGFMGQTTTECFVGHDCTETGDSLFGFIIGYVSYDPFVQLPLGYYVWMGNMPEGVLDHCLPDFEQMLRERGFHHWEWGTSRKGWARRAERFGAKVVEWKIRKDLIP